MSEGKRKRRGKPQDFSKLTRNSQVKIRLTPEEVSDLKAAAAAADMSLADYVMASTKDSPVIVIEGVPQLLQELRRQGTNLNQMVRLAHQEQSTNIPDLMAAVHRCVVTQAEITRLCHSWNVRLIEKTEKGE